MVVRILRIRLALLGVVASACTGDGEPASIAPPPPAPAPAPLTGSGPFVVSDPAAGTTMTLLGSTPSSLVDDVAYISLPPGSVVGGSQAMILVDRTGRGVTRPLLDGGFDPVAVPAAAGDTITITLTHTAVAPEVFRFTVPAKKPPVIVRTVPPRNKRDVPLNARMVVVFSEPIDAASLTERSISIHRGIDGVPGTLAFITGDQTAAEFTPTDGLLGSTAYELVITADIRDYDGMSLESVERVGFTTQQAPVGGLAIAVDVTGAEFAPSSFTIRVDGGTPRAVTAGTNPIIGGLAAGPHVVALGGLNVYCAVEGPATRTVVVAVGEATPVDWRIACAPSAPRQLAFVRDGEIFLANTDGSGLIRLTDPAPGVVHGEPAWSPDGTMLAYSRMVGGPSAPEQDIYVMNSDGSNKVRLTTQGQYNTSPTWSPDGEHIAFTSLRDGSFDVFTKRSSHPSDPDTRVTTSPGWDAFPDWSPDGRTIVYSSDWRAYDFLSDLFTINPDGSAGRTLIVGPFFSNEGLRYHYQASWSPTGAQLAFVVCNWSLVTCFPSSDIVVANADGTGARVVAQSGGSAKPSWSRDGRMIAYSEWTCQACAPSIRFVLTDGTGEGLLIANGHSPAYRP